MRPDVRALAIERSKPERDKQALLALCSVVHNGQPAFTKDCWALLRRGYSFANRLEVQTIRPMLEQLAERNPHASKTIGELARTWLTEVTNKDFGEDAPMATLGRGHRPPLLRCPVAEGVTTAGSSRCCPVCQAGRTGVRLCVRGNSDLLRL